jgi:tetratricopeptide (TPR) repeat protein
MLDGRAQLYMQSRQPDRTLAALEAAQPVLEAQGRPARQAHYFNNRAALRARQNRHRVDEETIALIRRAAAAAARETGDEANIAWMTAGLGWTLVMAGQFDEAQRLVEGSLANAERIGDAVLQGGVPHGPHRRGRAPARRGCRPFPCATGLGGPQC